MSSHILPRKAGDVAAQKNTRDLHESLRAVEATPMLQGKDLPADGTEFYTLANAATTKIKHGLGYRLRGWLVTDVVFQDDSGFAGSIVRVLSDASGTADPTKDLWLAVRGYGGETPMVRLRVW